MKRSTLVIFISLIALVSVAYSFYYQAPPAADANGYDLIAWNLVNGHGYVEDVQNEYMPEKDEAIIRVGPGYQFFLAGLYWVFGHSLWVVWVAHALLRALTAYIILLIVIRLFPGQAWVVIFAMILFGFWPDLIVANGLLLTETLFLFLLMSAVYASLRALDENGLTYAMVAGAAWGTAILTRPTALLPLSLVVIALCLQKRFRGAVLALCIAACIVAPWSYFVSKRFHSLILTTTVGGYDLWVGNNLDARGGFEKTLEIQNARKLYHSVELDRIGKRRYATFIMEHPLGFIELQIRKTALYFSAFRPTGFWFHIRDRVWELRATLVASFAWSVFVFFFGIAGAILFFREQRTVGAVLFLLFALFQPLSVIPIIVETRYRYPLYPFLAIFAAYFLARRPWPRREVCIAAAVLVCAAGYDFVSYSAEIIAKIQSIL